MPFPIPSPEFVLVRAPPMNASRGIESGWGTASGGGAGGGGPG
ncbi:MAG: hypothetical protein ACRDUS_11735 [Mycobacterium sp.]